MLYYINRFTSLSSSTSVLKKLTHLQFKKLKLAISFFLSCLCREKAYDKLLKMKSELSSRQISVITRLSCKSWFLQYMLSDIQADCLIVKQSLRQILD
jgi:hypothetical protein